MSQKITDFVKTKGSKLVLAQNDDYYLEIKKQRSQDQVITELNNRISVLEQEVANLKNLIRAKLSG